MTRFDRLRQALVNDPKQRAFCGRSGEIACDADQAIGLMAHIRDSYGPSSDMPLNTFTYNMFGFNEGINGDEPESARLKQDMPDLSQTAVTGRTELADIAAGVNRLTIGANTHLNPPVIGQAPDGKPHVAVMPALVDLVGQTRPDAGTTPDNPLKFVIIVTDGLSSDINWNWLNGNPPPVGAPPTGMLHPPHPDPEEYCALWRGPAPKFRGVPLWQGDGGTENGECNTRGYRPGYLESKDDFHGSGMFDGNNYVFYSQPLDPSYCAKMKENAGQAGSGVTVAVVETPYVPLVGESSPLFPYEGGVQSVIYPNGNPATHPGTGSALSAALRACASGPQYYFLASEDTDIAAGLVSVFDHYVGSLGQMGRPTTEDTN